MDVVIDISERRTRFRNRFVRFLSKTTLGGQNIDDNDNDNAFRLIEQLNTCYKYWLSCFAERYLHNNQLEDLPKDVFSNNINLIEL